MLMSIRLNVLMCIRGKVAVTLVVLEQSIHDKSPMDTGSREIVAHVVIIRVLDQQLSGLVTVPIQSGIAQDVVGPVQVLRVLVVTER